MSVSTEPAPAPARAVPRLFARLVDDAAVLVPGGASLAEALAGHARHRAAWYAGLVGPLVVPASAAAGLPALLAPGERLTVGVLADTGPAGLAGLAPLADRVDLAQVEIAVAKRGEDPLPGLREFLQVLAGLPATVGYAEIPLTWGLLTALDTLAQVRAGGAPVAAKFRTGGLAAELFPTPVELAAVVCACRDRQLSFKLTAGLHHAIRYTDPETGLVHHGFLNVLAGVLTAAGGAEVADVAELLAATDPEPVLAAVYTRRDQARPLWSGFAARRVTEAVTDLRQLGLLDRDTAGAVDGPAAGGPA